MAAFQAALYYSGSSISKTKAMGLWRGRDVDLFLAFVPTDSWASVELNSWINTYKQSVNPDFYNKMIITAEPIPASGASLATAASGGYDSHYHTMIQNIVNGGLGNAWLRFGHEFNGGWYAWGTTDATAAVNYGLTFKRFVDIARSYSSNFKFCWNLALGKTVFPGHWPGDGYVDAIGIDIYDQWWGTPATSVTPQQRWNNFLLRPNSPNDQNGLTYWVNWAASKGLPLSFCEWGVNNTASSNGGGGGDDPYFIEQMYNFFVNHNVVFESYFNSSPSDGRHALYSLSKTPDFSGAAGQNPEDWDNTEFQQSAIRYRQLWGASDEPPPPGPPTEVPETIWLPPSYHAYA